MLTKLADERVAMALRPSDDALPVQDEIAELQRRRDDVTELVGEGLMDKAKARQKLGDLTERLRRAQVRLAVIRAESPLSDLRLAESIPDRWDALQVLERRRIISDLGLRLTINPAGTGARGIDPDTGKTYTVRAWTLLRIEWELPER